MTDLKRDEIKLVRDKAKSNYMKQSSCYICGDTDELQLHHVYSLTPLWNKFKKKNKITITSTEDMLIYRDTFISAHHTEIYEKVLTLCKHCHNVKLHGIYGKVPGAGTAKKQLRWAEIQRNKRLEKEKEYVN